MKKTLLFFLLLSTITTKAQYTDIINSNKPGRSMGAYAVGRKVAQVESDIYYETNKHDLLGLSQETVGLNYMNYMHGANYMGAELYGALWSMERPV